MVVAGTVVVSHEASNGSEQNTPLAFADLAEEPEQYYDQGATVSGTAAQVVELSSFAVTIQQLARNEELLAGLAALVDRGVLVVVAGSSGTNLTYPRSVPACGTFAEFDPSSFAEELGAGLDDGSRTYRYGRRELLAQQMRQSRGNPPVSSHPTRPEPYAGATRVPAPGSGAEAPGGAPAGPLPATGAGWEAVKGALTLP